MAKPDPTPTVEKRRVTMRTAVAGPGGSTLSHEAVDYVPVDVLDAYVADAQTRWQSVEVGDTHDAGPGGDKGDTVIPDTLKGA